MPEAVFRVRLHDGGERLAVGEVDDGPRSLLDRDITLDVLLSDGGPSLADALSMGDDAVPGGARVLPPIGSQEIWAAGVTYLRSRDARVEEAVEASVYDRVYGAKRPELFFKSPGWRARGPGEAIGIRSDSSWDVPEPELTLVVDAGLRIVGYTIGNDASSRSIEGDNPLYLSQAKVYDGSTGLGPAIVPATEVDPPFGIAIRISRGGEAVYDGVTSTGKMARPFEELVAYLGRALRFPAGVFLMTGTGLVPEAGFTLSPDDVVTISVDGLGELRNPVERVGTAPPG